MRKTKIICTIGPASMNEEILTRMCLAGMNVARMNFSHGDHEEQGRKIALVKKVRQKLGLPIAIMLDTKGPEYRIGTFKNEKVTVNDGDTFTFTVDDVEGDEKKVSVNFKQLNKNLQPGDTVTVCNGMVKFEVQKIVGSDIICKCLAGGELSNRKSMSFPKKIMSGPYLREQDKKDIIFGIQQGVDFVAASFVSTKQDVLEIRELLDANGGSDIEIIAKIENQSGVDNVEEICSACGGIMIARGDLGVEIPFVEVPVVQKRLTQKCRMMGKRVITATEMMESMIHNPRPTRAEINDVANAVYDGTSCVMLSGESAAGKYPVEAVQAMAEIAEYTEQHTNYKHRFLAQEYTGKNNLDCISHAVCSMAIDVGAKAIVVCSTTGRTAMLVSRFRTPVDIIGMTTDGKIWRRLSMSWGVTPVMAEQFPSVDVMFYYAKKAAIDVMNLQPGDNILLTGGPVNGSSGNTDTIKLEVI
ncbi:MAG TPA: pyruvate kinase [Candidatus Faecousia faecipullorum]|nr:pyruvate kinase [Candidatus Faecousia faecipullorum]